tara:strand:+ start:276 stop:1352 length:1077 start_codon:yes stop_codon:yes gene_type:complete
MKENNFIYESNLVIEGETKWIAPSNIALVKYWGKKSVQLPKNPSISFTLSNCVTETSVIYTPKKRKKEFVDYDFFFEGKTIEEFDKKIQLFFKRIYQYVPWIKNYSFIINSNNSFPHSSGIASSASSMASLSLCLMDIERILFPEMELDYFNNKASFLSRLGSGSASRSIKGPICIWGSSLSFKNSNDYYATEFGENIHNVFKSYKDTILIIDDKKKKVSSSKGHDLMKNNPFSKQRINQSNNNIDSLISILKSGDLDSFIKIVELEALTLHALMMTSSPSYILINPETLNVINKIIDYRESTKIPICFTLDAGPNIHLLYPASFSNEVLDFIKSELINYCKEGKFILDKVGRGAKKI